jgi:CRP-like cAMP-binding protein
MEDLTRILREQEFLKDLEPEYLEQIVGCASNVRIAPDEYLFREGDDADAFYLIRHGRVAVEMEVNFQPRIVMTLDPGQMVGWSWLLPPYQYRTTARAMVLTRAIYFDGRCLREKCEENHSLGYSLMKRFVRDAERRLYRAWMQVGDMYSAGAP